MVLPLRWRPRPTSYKWLRSVRVMVLLDFSWFYETLYQMSKVSRTTLEKHVKPKKQTQSFVEFEYALFLMTQLWFIPTWTTFWLWRNVCSSLLVCFCPWGLGGPISGKTFVAHCLYSNFGPWFWDSLVVEVLKTVFKELTFQTLESIGVNCWMF